MSYHLLDGDVEKSIELAVTAISAWRVAHAKESTKWFSAATAKKRLNKMYLSGPFLLQKVLFEKSEALERAQESEWKSGKRNLSSQTLYVRYIKHLILQAINHLSFHVVVATAQVLRTYDDDQASTIYYAVRPAPARRARRWRAPYEEIKAHAAWRDRFFASLVNRFYASGAFAFTTSWGGMEPRFVMLPDTSGLTQLVRDALQLFTPWGVEMVIPNAFSRYGPAPKEFRFEGRRPVDELPFEYRRAAALINPLGFDRIVGGLGYEGADSKLQLPQVDTAMPKQEDDGGALRAYPGLSDGQIIEALDDLIRGENARKELRASALTVEVDGAPRGQAPVKLRRWFSRGARASAHLAADARSVEVYASDRSGGGRVSVSYLSLPATEIEQGRRWRSSIKLEGGQSILLKVNPELDASGRLAGSTLEVFYRERFSPSALYDSLREGLTLRSARATSRLWAGAALALLLVLFGTLIIVLSSSGRLKTLTDLFRRDGAVPSRGQQPATNVEPDAEKQARDDRENAGREGPGVSPAPVTVGGNPTPSPEASPRNLRSREGPGGRLGVAGRQQFAAANKEVEGSRRYGARITYANLLDESFMRPAEPVKPVPAGEQTMSGGQSAMPLRAVAPNGVAVRTRTPTLTWESSQAGGRFIIAVYDDDPARRYTPVVKGEQESGGEWTPPQPLERGRRYTWQVRQVQVTPEADEKNAPAAEGRFRIISDDELRRLEAAEAVYPRSSLVMSHLYARAGLLPEAEAELLKLESKEPRSKIVQRLLRDVQRQLRDIRAPRR